MTSTAIRRPSPADDAFGYPFGERGILTIAATAKMLSCSRRTVERRIASGYLRKGYAKPGAITSGVVICRRSLEDFLGALEV